MEYKISSNLSDTQYLRTDIKLSNLLYIKNLMRSLNLVPLHLQGSRWHPPDSPAQSWKGWKEVQRKDKVEKREYLLEQANSIVHQRIQLQKEESMHSEAFQQTKTHLDPRASSLDQRDDLSVSAEL